MFDTETGDEYWISGVKKDGNDRHWAGHGKIVLARNIEADYLAETGQQAVDKSRFVVEDIPK